MIVYTRTMFAKIILFRLYCASGFFATEPNSPSSSRHRCQYYSKEMNSAANVFIILTFSLFLSLSHSWYFAHSYVRIGFWSDATHAPIIQIGWGICVFNGLTSTNGQLCALSSPSDNSLLYSRQPTKPTKSQCSTP